MCEVQWQLDRLTETDRQMKQTQGPQRWAFCTNHINTFNKAFGYQSVVQQNLTVHTICQNVQMLQKWFAIQAIKKHHRNSFNSVFSPFFKRQLCREASGKRGRAHRAKAQSENDGRKANTDTSFDKALKTTLSDSTAKEVWSVTLVEGVVRGAEVCLLQQQR